MHLILRTLPNLLDLNDISIHPNTRLTLFDILNMYTYSTT